MNMFDASASALGYLYQVRYALLLLLGATPRDEISVEFLDDIAFEREGEPRELFQTKHHVTSQASLSNASSDLWKTIRIWSTAYKENLLNANTMLTLITTSTSTENTAARKLRPNSLQGRDVNGALQILRQVASTSSSITNKLAYEVYLSLSDAEQAELINKIRIIDNAPDILSVRTMIENKLAIVTRPQYIGPLCERVEGWWFNRVIMHLSEPQGDTISFLELSSFMNDIAEQFFTDNLPIDFFDLVAPDESNIPERNRIFIEQLKLISVNQPRIRKAIEDFYKAYAQRSRWIREDLLYIGEIERYEKLLVDEWERLFLIAQESLGENATEENLKDTGKTLYNLVETKLNISIRPRCSTPYVMRGSYHMLANDLMVGWHPEFLGRLQHLIRKAEEAVT